jgi:hypothetical protein
VVDVWHGAADTFPAFYAVRGGALRLLRVHPRLPELSYGGSVTYRSGLDCTTGREPGSLVAGEASTRNGRSRHVVRRFYARRRALAPPRRDAARERPWSRLPAALPRAPQRRRRASADELPARLTRTGPSGSLAHESYTCTRWR